MLSNVIPKTENTKLPVALALIFEALQHFKDCQLLKLKKCP
jgi:hypothetical protein